MMKRLYTALSTLHMELLTWPVQRPASLTATMEMSRQVLKEYKARLAKAPAESPEEDIANVLQGLAANHAARAPGGPIDCLVLTIPEYEGIIKRLTDALTKLKGM